MNDVANAAGLNNQNTAKSIVGRCLEFQETTAIDESWIGSVRRTRQRS